MIFSILKRLLASCLIAVPLIVQPLPIYSETSSVATNGSFLEPRLHRQFRIMDCDLEHTDAINTAIAEIPQVLARTMVRLEDLISQLETPGFDIFEDLDDTDYSTLDTFGVLYGRLLLTDSEVDATDPEDEPTAVDILNDYLDFAGLMYNAVASIATQNLDVTCNNDWTNEKNNDDEDYGNATGNDGTDYYYDKSGNNFGWIQIKKVCQKHPTLEGFTFSISSNLMVENQNTLASIIAICPLATSRAQFKTTLTSIKDKTLAKSDSLEKLASQTATFLLLHEFSHALSLVGGYAKDDNAYSWGECLRLVDEGSVEMAISNADSFAFFAAAMFLDTYTWYTGQALPKDDHMESEQRRF
ncbi:uncharacterized protein Bfra_008252 [Botrytis fragariae]|uniref:Lysine-specific metallo-endopeptidase domain-containing protein n=1 Tax=Botrytis fragariae TaxID=1964551 RepID=A0A8H6AT88_9HELO|nr:uncharacterized protein Bfra_008252 [Botrytis fragariae]KAF5872975.1 hypothetical protein Bfra_008252 [Botrytis fragariae]